MTREMRCVNTVPEGIRMLTTSPDLRLASAAGWMITADPTVKVGAIEPL